MKNNEHHFVSIVRTLAWNYDPYRGWLNSKVYDEGHGTTYGYTLAGRLATRLWARGTDTTYSYDGAGGMASASYNDGLTPGLTNGYDRLGRRASITNGATVTSLAYNDGGQVLSESYTGGPLGGWAVTNGYDAFLRRTNLVVLSNGTAIWTITNSYDAASRLAVIGDGTNSATYSYLANSSLVSQIAFKQNGTTRMTTSKNWDNLDRLTSISSTANSTVVSSTAYAYNAANQRTSATSEDGSYWAYGYDRLGQVTSASRFWSDGKPVAGEQFGNAFDDIGNRTSTQTGGNDSGTGLRTALYVANDLNQYTTRTIPGYVDILGTASSSAIVTVNSLMAYRHGSFYEATLPLDNAGVPVWLSVTNLGVLGGSSDIVSNVTGNAFIPANPENYAYDYDGNLTQDGRFSYSWDGENRLTNITSIAGAATGSLVKLDIAYDYQGRRVQKIVSTNSGTGYVPSYTNKFIYDGWNVIAVLDGGNNLIRSFVWGSDLSGSMQGAGGVGGLISMTVYGGANSGSYFYCYDGNGNVTALANAANGTLAAQYWHGPFGELIGQTGPTCGANPFRFSTKCQDDETGLLYYGYRYYNSSTGRWLSRDPINERGFQVFAGLPRRFSRHEEENLYCFLRNRSINRIDKLGLTEGTYTIKNTTMTLNEDDLAKRDGAKNPVKAFRVKYAPDKPCACDPKKIVLVQAIENNHTWTTPDPDPKFDGSDDYVGTLPPPYGGRHISSLEYLDSPYYSGFWNLTWSIEVCALCRDGTKPEVNLGCHTFTWHKETVDEEGDFAATEPGSLWKAATAAWTKAHPDQ